MTAPRVAAAAAALGVALALSTPARAQTQESAAARRAAAAHEMDRPHTMVALSGGLQVLRAQCAQFWEDCEQKGELSASLGLYNQYRMGPFAVGAGIVWSNSLLSDAARGAANLDREHNRSYFLVDAQFRYYALRSATFGEWWGGLTLGGVVVKDAWTVKADRDPYADTDFVGPRAATLATEGLAAGLAVGMEWSLFPNISVGASLRYASWFLPRQPVPSPTMDVASLSGRVDMIDLGLVLAYRVAL
jgi:hypothetical protein